MTVDLPYGKGWLRETVPAGSTVLSLAETAALPDPAAAVAASLRASLGSRPLADLARAKKARAACVVVSDHTRPVPARILLPPLLAELEKGGVPPGRVTVLIACGMHRPTSDGEKLDMLGPEVLGRCRVLDHRAGEPGQLARLTVAGRPVTLNRAYLASPLKILTGFVEPHFMAGFSGGRKSVCPGIAGRETLECFHGWRLMASPAAVAGRLSGNPCHLFALRVAEAAGVDFIVNVTLNRRLDITGVFSGGLRAAHRAGVRACRRQTAVFFDRPFDIVLTTNGGYPLDRDFYQSVKGLVAVLDMVRPGGVIVCAAGCADGLGSADFRALLAKMETPAQFDALLRRPGFFRVDQWEVQKLAGVLARARVKLFSGGLSPAEARLGGVEPVDSVAAGIAAARRELGVRARLAVAPDGPYAIYRRSDRAAGSRG